VTCRVARLSQDLSLRIIDLVFCCECGSSNLEVCYTSKTLGPHLYPIQSRVRNMGENPNAIAEEGTACCLNRYRYTQVDLKYEPQTNRKKNHALSSLPRTASV